MIMELIVFNENILYVLLIAYAATARARAYTRWPGKRREPGPGTTVQENDLAICSTDLTSRSTSSFVL
jgi:hypothetical protein